MANKKYTLYFKGKNRFNDEFDMPIVSLSLKELDIYTSKYENYSDLFNALPEEIKSFITREFDVNDLENKFYITDYDFSPIMNVIFKKDSDVLFVEPKELRSLLENSVMSTEEFQKSRLRSIRQDSLSKKYDFYSYLYNTYVKNNKVKCMIDLYYVSKKEIEDDDLKYIEAIATDKVNLIVLSKKLSQTEESRRNLAYEFKKSMCGGNIIDDDLINYRRKENYEFEKVFSSMIINFTNFKKEYERVV